MKKGGWLCCILCSSFSNKGCNKAAVCDFLISRGFWWNNKLNDVKGVIFIMEIIISDEALKWFKNDIGLTAGDQLRFYSKIYGSSPVQQGYSLAFAKQDPINMVVSTELEGILFFIEDNDLWYFDGHDLHVDYHKLEDDLEYTYVKNS
jgi:uncharacterized protein YneR